MKRTTQAGQTLVALLIFMAVAMTITFAATAVTIINIRSNNGLTTGEIALQNATSGIENATIQLERKPSYTGETMSMTNGSATITVSGTGPFTITSVGAAGNYRRTVTATATVTGNVLSLSNWSETP